MDEMMFYLPQKIGNQVEDYNHAIMLSDARGDREESRALRIALKSLTYDARLNYITLNAGHTRPTDGDFDETLCRVMKPWLQSLIYRYKMPAPTLELSPYSFHGYRDKMGALLIIIKRTYGEIIATLGVSATKNQGKLAWETLTGIAEVEQDQPEAPWCAVALNAHMRRSKPFWLSGFKRCVASTWLTMEESKFI